MRVEHGSLEVETSGHGHVIDLTSGVCRWLESIGAIEGQLTVFNRGSTAAITTIEYETGAVKDLDVALETIAPKGPTYHHDARWGDGNGFSHLRAALLGPSLAVPVIDGQPTLGTWQQIILVECDNRARRRSVVVSFVGECS